MKIKKFHKRITKIMKFLIFDSRTMKIMKILKSIARIPKIMNNLRMSCENTVNRKSQGMSYEKHENHETNYDCMRELLKL